MKAALAFCLSVCVYASASTNSWFLLLPVCFTSACQCCAHVCTYPPPTWSFFSNEGAITQQRLWFAWCGKRCRVGVLSVEACGIRCHAPCWRALYVCFSVLPTPCVGLVHPSLPACLAASPTPSLPTNNGAKRVMCATQCALKFLKNVNVCGGHAPTAWNLRVVGWLVGWLCFTQHKQSMLSGGRTPCIRQSLCAKNCCLGLPHLPSPTVMFVHKRGHAHTQLGSMCVSRRHMPPAAPTCFTPHACMHTQSRQYMLLSLLTHLCDRSLIDSCSWKTCSATAADCVCV